MHDRGLLLDHHIFTQHKHTVYNVQIDYYDANICKCVLQCYSDSGSIEEFLTKRKQEPSEPRPVCGYLSKSENKIKVTSCSQGSSKYGMICVKRK